MRDTASEKTTGAAVILCAGKGTRMNDNSKNKVSFDCAGVPVIRRIVDNMRLGGVTRFIIVVGFLAQTVMDALNGEEGVVYAYQKEQKGTGHAALCGLEALRSLGFSGPSIVSMGDKIIAPSVIAELLQHSRESKAVWGVQPAEANPNGGRVVVADGRPFGVVEKPDAALMSLAGLPAERWQEKLCSLGLNEKKAAKVIQKAESSAPSGETTLCGRVFTAEEILATPYANAGLYCFDTEEVVEAIRKCRPANAQGEIYITDTLEQFASRGEAQLYSVKNAGDMRTYSTKPELRAMGESFLRTASQFIASIRSGELRERFADLYGSDAPAQEKRYIDLLEHFISSYGDQKVVITRAPGRVNLMGRHIDHRGGGINVMTVDRDTVLVASPRNDDTIRLTNLDSTYEDDSFSIGAMLNLAPHDEWLSYLAAPAVVEALRSKRGSWSNYAKSAALRFALSNENPLCGMDCAACGNIPVAAGLSSSSSIVVAVAEAIVALNSLNLTDRDFIDLCGEGEWYVGSRGGAGDHAAMKCGRRGKITHLGFKPFTVGDSAPFTEEYAVLVADSMTKAKKSEGSKDRFNAKVASYEFAFMLLKRDYPEFGMREFRDLAAIRPAAQVYRMLRKLPESITRNEVLQLLPEYEKSISQIFSNHADPGTYNLRGVALYGVAECVRAEKCIEALKNEDYALLGRMMKISQDGDRVAEQPVSDALLDSLAESDAELYLQRGAYGCSTERIDFLCDLLDGTDGVLGSEIVGAGLGGCVIALIERKKADKIIEILNREYYDRYGYAHAANVFLPSAGSAVIY